MHMIEIAFSLLIGVSVLTVSAQEQDMGKLKGNRKFEELENRLLGKHLLEEAKAIDMLEKELEYRKVRYKMLKLGSRNVGISDEPKAERDVPVLNFDDEKKNDRDGCSFRWRLFIGREIDVFVESLKPAATEFWQAKLRLLSAQIERLNYEKELAQKRQDVQQHHFAKAPFSKEEAHQGFERYRLLLRDLESQITEKMASFEQLSNLSFDPYDIRDSIGSRKDDTKR